MLTTAAGKLGRSLSVISRGMPIASLCGMIVRFLTTGFVIAIASVLLAGCGSIPLTDASHELSWTQRHGGAVSGNGQQRAQRLCDDLCFGITASYLKVFILESSRLGGWSWPDGHIYLTSALVSTADNAELAAAMAHEMGHLVNNHNINIPQALARGEEHLGIESAADLTGCRILARNGFASTSMMDVLKMVRVKSSDPVLRHALAQRIMFLNKHIGSIAGGYRKQIHRRAMEPQNH